MVEGRRVPAPSTPWTPQPPAVSPVTAYAPIQDVSQAVATGRGLY
jgi:hypothetical protein